MNGTNRTHLPASAVLIIAIVFSSCVSCSTSSQEGRQTGPASSPAVDTTHSSQVTSDESNDSIKQLVTATQPPEPTALYPAVAMTGVLNVDAQGCLFLDVSNGQSWPVVWPWGSQGRIVGNEIQIFDNTDCAHG
jgi:PBP1b-binding outer membrane lipoprotein LpoB